MLARRALFQGWLYSALLISSFAHAEDWLPISKEDLEMRSTPKAPNAPAIFLYREVKRDDTGPSESVYERIKILTEAGRDRANIELRYVKNSEVIRGIHARTIRPDGTIVNFNGEIFDKNVVQTSGVKLMAKIFTLPNAEVGSIIEYRYRTDMQPYYVFNSHWILSQSLFTQYGKFSLDRSTTFTLRYSTPIGIPEGATPPNKVAGKIVMEVRDVPAFVTEDYMPPENELKYRVDFIYDDSDYASDNNPVTYWNKFGKQSYKKVAKFIDEPRAMKEAVAQIIAADDSADAKLRKIYARVQSIRNLSFEEEKGDQEKKREKLKEAGDVGEVWKYGYADGNQITWLFLGLVRAAGFEAYPVYVSTRNKYFFSINMMNTSQLNDNIVVVMLDGKQRFFDPGAKFAAFAELPWYETGVTARLLDKDGGKWISTKMAPSAESRILRKAKFKMTENGTLEGTVDVTYTGQEARWRRLEELSEDETDRKKFLEKQVQAWIPSGSEVQLTSSPEWESSSTEMQAQYSVRIPGWTTGAGSRMFMPTAFFNSREKGMFVHSAREHPIYFDFATQDDDDVSIELPAGLKPSSLPPAHAIEEAAFAYKTTYESTDSSVHLQRSLRLDMTLVATKFYGTVQEFFQKVRSADEEQAVIGRVTKAAK
jgi:Domain of Unknown Function with PDB structure (DUF3857)